MKASSGSSGQQLIMQDFNPPWSGNTSPDGDWRIAGTWVGTGGNTLSPANATISSSYSGTPGGYLSLTTSANQLVGAEIQTLSGTCSYGYYEVRMKVTSVPGVVASFFWKELNYGAGELDIEFLTNESWINSPNSGQVHFTLHPGWDTYGTVKVQNLNFNPSLDFHRYGFLWQPTKFIYTVDGVAVCTFTNPPAANLVNPTGGYIMMNTWTGSPGWGGGPPTQDATTIYDWVKYYPGATTIQP